MRIIIAAALVAAGVMLSGCGTSRSISDGFQVGYEPRVVVKRTYAPRYYHPGRRVGWHRDRKW